jgi:hypothetical protein
LAPLLPQASGHGRNWTSDLREVVNALRYRLRSLLFRAVPDVALTINREQAGTVRRH